MGDAIDEGLGERGLGGDREPDVAEIDDGEDDGQDKAKLFGDTPSEGDGWGGLVSGGG